MRRTDANALPGLMADGPPAASAVRPSPWLLVAGLMVAANLWLHLPITDACDWLVRRVGFLPYDAFLKKGFLAAGLATAGYVAVAPPARRQWRAARGTMALVAGAVLVQRTLLVSAIENIHYPQFALLAVLLRKSGLRFEMAWLATVGLGTADEVYQYFELPRGTPGYFDWNDVVLNAMGAAFGVLLFAIMGTGRDGHGRPLPRRQAIILALTAGAGALLLSAPSAGPFYTVTPGGRVFHRLTSAEGLLIVGGLWSALRWVARELKYRTVERPEEPQVCSAEASCGTR